MLVYIHVNHLCAAGHRVQKGIGSMALGLQVVVSHHVGTELNLSYLQFS